MQKIIFAIGAGVVLSTTYTMAQQGQIREEYAADIRAACGDVAPGGIRSCLNSHLADLSRPCQAVLVAVAAVANACRGDVSSLCGGVEPGRGRIEACLQSNVTKLSAPCVDVMSRTVGRGP
jgi:Cysteine rich repeat